MSTTAIVYPRIGLVGNPSDGYGGCVIAASFRNFAAEVSVTHSANVQIFDGFGASCGFGSLAQLVAICDKSGHSERHRLMTAAIRRFLRHVEADRVDLSSGLFVHYQSTIPREVGLAGSSALIVAALKALDELFGTALDDDTLIDLALKAETEELGIAAGLMDRTVQLLKGVLFFDCAAASVSASAKRIDPSALPNLFLAGNDRLARDSGLIHGDVKERYEAGDEKVHHVMKELRALAQQAFALVTGGRGSELGPIFDRNYDLRASIFHIDPRHDEMVQTARKCGASAKFAGSGGAVVGTYADDAMLARLTEAFDAIGCAILVPEIGQEL